MGGTRNKSVGWSQLPGLDPRITSRQLLQRSDLARYPTNPSSKCAKSCFTLDEIVAIASHALAHRDASNDTEAMPAKSETSRMDCNLAARLVLAPGSPAAARAIRNIGSLAGRE